MEVVRTGEAIHIIERRLFSEAVRRHFVGEVLATSDRPLRVRGYLFVYDTSASTFSRKPELRTRIVSLDNRVVVNVLPSSVDVNSVRYARDSDGNLTLTDNFELDLDISEFSTRE